MDKREGLTARFRRVLGRPLPETGHDETRAEALEARQSSSRRREQVLHAQRTHRHRTQQYIRELENEVFRLRDENHDLRQKLVQMQTMPAKDAVLAHNRSQVNNHPNTNLERRIHPQTVTRDDNLSDSSPITINLTGLAKEVPQGSCENHPAEIAPPTYQPRFISTSDAGQSHPPTTSFSPDQTGRYGGLTTQLGINFILTLEAPCLAHIKHAHMGYNTGTTPREITYNSGPGHLLTASAMLTHRYYDRDLETAPITVPSIEIEHLLETSGRLKLDGEITPVQIWARIKQLSSELQGRYTGNVETKIGVLIEELQKYTYCNSFGAVAERATVEFVLADILGQEPY